MKLRFISRPKPAPEAVPCELHGETPDGENYCNSKEPRSPVGPVWGSGAGAQLEHSWSSGQPRSGETAPGAAGQAARSSAQPRSKAGGHKGAGGLWGSPPVLPDSTQHTAPSTQTGTFPWKRGWMEQGGKMK